jgi:hypothetical protein
MKSISRMSIRMNSFLSGINRVIISTICQRFKFHAESIHVAEHIQTNKHTVDTKKTKVLSHEKYWYLRHIWEAIEIENHKTNYNRDDGLKLSRIWTQKISHISKQTTWYMQCFYHPFLSLLPSLNDLFHFHLSSPSPLLDRYIRARGRKSWHSLWTQ